jgi:hypothetical protein
MSLIQTLTDRTPNRPDGFEYLPIKRPAPRRPRDLFDVIGELGDRARTEVLMAVFNWKEVDPRQMFSAVLGRLPYMKELDELPPDYSPRGHMRRLVMSPEFRLRIIRRILDCYPEKQRLMFVQIPRCGGSMLQRRLDTQHPFIGMDITDPAKVDDEEMVAWLGQRLGRLRNSRTLLLGDRIPLRAFLHSPMQKNDARGGAMRAWEFDISAYRLGDRLFTVVREPEEIILSQVNQILRERKIGGRRPDPGTPEILEEGGKILASIAGNPICRALGEGNVRTAMPLLRISNIEITLTEHLDTWMNTTFAINAERGRTPPRLFAREHLTEEQRTQLAAKVSEDRTLYDHITAVIAERGRTYALGQEVWDRANPPADRAAAD